MINPLFLKGTAHYLLRLCFCLKRGLEGVDLNEMLPPRIELEKTMVHVPKIRPGEYVAWHYDSEQRVP